MNGDWLVLETSGRAAKLGLARGGAVVRSATLDDSRRHARDLAATVAGFLEAESLKPRDLAGIVVGRGPGSYTGLRVGLTSAKALAYAVGCKLVAVDTFAAIAAQAPPGAESLWVIADALQGQVYLQRFQRDPTPLASLAAPPLKREGQTSEQALLAPPSISGKGAGGLGSSIRAADELRIVRVEEWLPLVANGTWVSGPGVKVYADRIPNDCRLVGEADREPRVESVFAAGSRVEPLTREELFALEPLYLRGSSAEEKAKAAK